MKEPSARTTQPGKAVAEVLEVRHFYEVRVRMGTLGDGAWLIRREKPSSTQSFPVAIDLETLRSLSAHPDPEIVIQALAALPGSKLKGEQERML